MKTLKISIPGVLAALWLLLAMPVEGQSQLQVNGVIESKAGGFRFPDGSLQKSARNRYARVVVVAASGGDYQSVQKALGSITDASDSKRYLVKVAPGTFVEQVTMKSYVDIEGSGQLATRLTSPLGPTVTCADDAEIRFLTVAGSAPDGSTIYCDGTSPRLTHVSVWIQGSSGTCRGMLNDQGAMPVLRSVEIVENSTCGAAHALANVDSHPIVDELEVLMLGSSGSRVGVYNDAASPHVADTRIEIYGASTAYGVRNESGGAVVLEDLQIRLAPTSLGYGIRDSGGASTTLSESSIFIGSAQTAAYGARIEGGTLRLERVSIEIEKSSSGGFAYGVYLRGGSTTSSFVDVEIGVFGHTYNYGVRVQSTSLVARSLGIESGGGAFGYGIYMLSGAGAWTVKVDNSRIVAEDETLRGDAEFTVMVGGSQLAGEPVQPRGGVITCAGVWDENYVFSASTCP